MILMLQDILAKDLDLEIDPVKVASAEVLSKNRYMTSLSSL